MKKWIVLLALALSTQAYAKGKIQNEDMKSLSEITASVLTTTANLSSASPCLTSLGSITGLVVGLYVYDTTNSAHIAAGVTIVGIPGTCSSGQVQMSSNAVTTATGDTVTFGGQMSQLTNDTKVYVTANGYNNTLQYVFEHNIPSNPLTTLGDIEYGGVGGAPTRLGIGSAGQFLLVSGGIPTWGIPTVAANTFWAGPISGGSAPAAFRVITAPDRPLTTVFETSTFSVDGFTDVYSCGSGSFTGTLPQASTVPGRKIVFYKNDSSFSNIITIAPHAGDTINGGASKTLNTFAETFTFVSDGSSNWIMTDHNYPKNAISYGVNVTGTVSNPSTGTVTLNNGFYRRVSDDAILINWQYTQSSAGSAGSGAYLISIPGGISISTGFNVPDTNGQASVIGNGYLEANNAASNTAASVFVYDSTHLGVLIGNAGTLWGSGTGFDYAQGNITKFSITATVSISGWN